MRIDRVYTKGGDKGETSLIGGARVSKSDPRLECYGTVDEINASGGVATKDTNYQLTVKRYDNALSPRQALANALTTKAATGAQTSSKDLKRRTRISGSMPQEPLTRSLFGRALFSMQEEVADNPYFIRLGEALIRRPGKDLSLVAMGSMVPLCLQAADALSESIDSTCLRVAAA